MPVRLRLQRQGRKKQPFYFIVAADARSPRDGKFLEKIGTYNPTRVPADISLDNDKALQWLEKGAQASDTVHKILSYKGVLFKKHLLRGVKKGAFSLEEAEAKFQAWLDGKQTSIVEKKSSLSIVIDKQKAEKIEAERKVREAKNAARLAANTPPAAAEETPEDATQDVASAATDQEAQATPEKTEE